MSCRFCLRSPFRPKSGLTFLSGPNKDINHNVSATFSRSLVTNPSLSAGHLSTTSFLNSPVPTFSDGAMKLYDAKVTLSDLGFTYWPSDIGARTLELLHCQVGMPYWLAIITCGITARMFLWYCLNQQQKFLRTMHERRTTISEIEYELDVAKYNHLQEKARLLSYELAYHENSMRSSMLKVAPHYAIQGLVFLSMTRGLRRCNELLPAFQTEGLSWSPNLALGDVTPILPLITTASVLTFFAVLRKINPAATSQFGIGSSIKNEKPSVLKQMRLPAILSAVAGSFSYSGYISSSLNIYILATMNTSLVQNVILKNERVKNWANLPPVRKPRLPYHIENANMLVSTSDDVDGGSNKSSFWKDFKKRWSKMKQNATSQAERMSGKKGRSRQQDVYYQKWKTAGTGPVPVTYATNPLNMKQFEYLNK